MPTGNNMSAKPAADNKNQRFPPSRPSANKASNVNGLGSSPSFRGASSRPGLSGTNKSSSRPASSNASKPIPDDAGEDEARAENIALLDELRERVRRAESASEELQRHLDLLQVRLEESQQSQSRLEDQLHEKEVKVEELEADKVQLTRERRDLETVHDSERTALFKEKEEQDLREDEMQDTIQRLKDTLMQREERGAYNEGKEMSEQGKQRCSDYEQRLS